MRTLSPINDKHTDEFAMYKARMKKLRETFNMDGLAVEGMEVQKDPKSATLAQRVERKELDDLARVCKHAAFGAAIWETGPNEDDFKIVPMRVMWT